MKQKMHLKDRRLALNAGMDFPLCYAQARLLDVDKGRLWVTWKAEDVTCKRCKDLMRFGH